jgi:hypothetical protein
MATDTLQAPARRTHLQVVHTLRKRITFADEGNEVTVGYLPANAVVIGGGAMITTAFDDTSTIDVGFKDGNSTDDPNAYATALVATAVGYIALDALAATTNIMQTEPATVTVTLNDGSGAVAAGAAEIIIEYVLDNDG